MGQRTNNTGLNRTLVSLNKETVEFILRKKFSSGASRRGKFQIVLGIFVVLISLMFLFTPFPGIIFFVIFAIIAWLFISTGFTNIRDSKPNEQKISDGNYYLEKTTITNFKSIFDSETLDTHIFTFDDRIEIHAVPDINCDSVFYENGKIGDLCYLLFFDEYDEPEHIFDTRWWKLHPDMYSFVKTNEDEQPDRPMPTDQ